MANFNLGTLKRPDSLQETRTFTDPLHPGASVPITLLVRPDEAFATETIEVMRNLNEKYLVGDNQYVQSEGKSGSGPARLSMPDANGMDFKAVPLNWLLVTRIASLTVAERAACAVTGEEAYTPEEWALMSERMPNAFSEIHSFYDELFEKVRGLEKNLPKASTGNPSDLQSNSGQATTR